MDPQAISNAVESGNTTVVLLLGVAVTVWLLRELGKIWEQKKADSSAEKSIRPWREVIDMIAAITRSQEHTAHILEHMRQASEFEHKAIREALIRVEQKIERDSK